MATIALTLAVGCTRPAGSTGRTPTGRDSIPFGFGPPTATGRRPTPQGRPVDEAYVMPRIVASRTAPVTLYASDGDWCEVTEGKFREVKVGDRVTCAWHVATHD